MKVTETEFSEVFIIEPAIYTDERGYFLETWNMPRYRDAGMSANFVQDNLSFSTRGVLRGLHFQNPNGQGKLISTIRGEVFDVVVDVRVGSPTFGKWLGVSLSEENNRQIFIPPGFAHGFCVTSDAALFSYKCTDIYNPKTEISVLWNDPDIGIKWPVNEPIVSDKDSQALPLSGIERQRLPSYSKPGK